MRRWSLRILIALAVLLIVVIAVTQIVLSATNVPDRIVLAEVQEQLGLRMTAKSVDTGWFGSTVIRDVTISLPLAENSLLATPSLRVRHTWLPKLLLTRKVVIDVLELDDAQLVVTQDASGRWNLQDLIELLARTGGKQQAAATSSKRAGPKLPGVILHNGTVTVTDKAGRIAKLNPVEFSGLPDGRLVWQYDATIGSTATPTVKATGKLSPGFEWAHQVEFDVNGAGSLLEPWVGKLADPLNVAGKWEGELKNGLAVGRLSLTKAQAMGGDMSGIVRARAGGGTARVEPEQLTIKTAQNLLPELQVRSGAIELDGTTVRATRLQVAALAGVAQVDGRWAMDQDAGEIVAKWDELTQPGGANVTHSGSLSAAVTKTLGQPAVTADLASNGAVRGGNWRTQMKLTGGGRDWSDMNWTITAPALSWSGPPRNVMLDGLVAQLVTRGKAVELTSIQLPSAERVAGKGMVDFASQAWSVNLGGRGWPLPRVPEATLEFRLDAGGDFKLYKLNELFLKTGGVLVNGTGFYDRKIPKPLSLDIKLHHTPGATAAASPALQGTLRAETNVSGEAWPLDVGLTGKVFGEAVRMQGHAIGDVVIDVEGKATKDHASLTSNELDLLGGKWSLVGTWLAETDLTRVRVKVRDLPLAQCGEAMGRSDVTGMADGAWTFELPGFDRTKLTGSGDFEARRIKVGEFPVERAVGKMTMRSGRIEAGPIDLTQEEGKAVANVSVAIAAPKRPTVGLKATNWPVHLPAAGAALRVNTETKLDLDVATRHATGPLIASAEVKLNDQPLGKASIAADFNGHAVRVKALEADAFAGKASGNGNFDIDNLLATTGEIKWQDIDSAAVAAIFPKLNGIAGRYGGRATLRPANDPRALEPLRLDVILDSYGGSYKGATVGDATFTAFMNYEAGGDKPGDNKSGVGDRFRIVLSDTQDDPSLIRFADGIVRFWARYGRHKGISTRAGQVTLQLDRLSLDQLVHVAKKENKTMPGRVSGTITIAGPPDDPPRLFGNGTLRLTEADLGNAPGFDLLYIAMGRGADGGRGSLDLRLEASTLHVDSLKYSSKGTEVRGRGAIREVFKIPESPIEFIAMGSVRPFSALKLPWASDVDDILNAVASDVTTVIVDGTAGDPKRRLVPFSELTDSMKSFIVGDVRSETQSR